MNESFQLFREMIAESGGLGVAYAIVSVMIVIMGIVCLVLEFLVWMRYSSANRVGISCQLSGIEAARYALDQSGLQHVKVRRAGFIREGLFGNYYNVMTKTIYLRSWLGKIDKKRTVTAVALGVQKAALARLCEEGDRQAQVRGSLSLLGIFGPGVVHPRGVAWRTDRHDADEQRHRHLLHQHGAGLLPAGGRLHRDHAEHPGGKARQRAGSEDDGRIRHGLRRGAPDDGEGLRCLHHVLHRPVHT